MAPGKEHRNEGKESPVAALAPSASAADSAPPAAAPLVRKDFVLIIAVNFFTFLSFQLFPSALPMYAKHMGVSEGLLGWLMALTTISALVTRPFAGIIVDRYGRQGAIISGLVVMAVAIVLMGIIPAFSLLLALRFLQGIGWGFSTTANSTTASDVIPRPRFAEGMGYYSLSVALALAIGPALGIELLNAFGMQVLSGVSTGFLVVALVISFFITYKRIDPAAAPKRVELIEPAALFPSAVIFFITFTYGAVLTFMAIDAESRGIGSIALFFTVYALATLVSRPVSGMLVDRKGFTPAVVLGLVFTVPALFMIAGATSLWMYVAAAVLYGIGYGTLQSTLQAMALILAPPEYRGAANATYLLGFDGGIGLGALGSGALVGLFGYQGMFLVVACLPFVSAAVYGLGLRRGLDKPRTQGD